MMQQALNRPFRVSRSSVVAALVLLAVAAGAGDASAQRAYPSPEAAADAFTAVLKTGDRERMKEVLGSNWEEFVPTEGIPEEDIQAYLDDWKTKHEIVPDPSAPESGHRVVAVGKGDWWLPIPIVQGDAGWSFDPEAGVDEMKTRRIGRNELSAINATLAYFDAQREYASRDRNGDGFLEYAQRIVSTPGEMDGLYWAKLDDDEEESPLGPYFGGEEPGSNYHGYRYRILTSQGPSARGGARDYVVGGRMRGGFALLAWPAEWDETGIMSFMVNQRGTVYEANLGSETEAAAGAIKAFDPGSGWEPVQPPKPE